MKIFNNFISLSNNKITEIGAKDLATTIKELKFLKLIHLGFNIYLSHVLGLCDKGVSEIARSLICLK